MELEDVECCGVRLQLPSDVCWDFSLLAEIISPETWNNCLTEENREELMNFLPTFPENDLEEKTRTLEMFFMDVNFRYGTPLRQFHQLLQSGHFNPSIAKQRSKKEAINRKIWRYQYSDYLRVTLEETIVRRQHYIDLAMTLGPGSKPPRLLDLPLSLSSVSAAAAGDARSSGSWQASIDIRTKRKYFRELIAARTEAGLSAELSDDEHYPEGGGALLSKKQRRLLCSAESSLPLKLLPVRHTHSSGSFARDLELVMTSQYNPLELTDANFEDLMAKFIYNKRTKRKNGEYCAWSDTTGITLTDVIWRVCESSKRMPPGLSPSLTTSSKPPLKARAKKDRLPGEGGSQAWSAVCGIKVEEPDAEQEENSRSSTVDGSQNGDKLSSLARYVSLGCGEVKNEGGTGDVEGKGRKRTVKAGALLPAKRRALDQAGREGVAVNGTAVKEEPPDEDPLSGWDSALSTSRSCSDSAPISLLPQSHSCFFCLLRDIICQPAEQRLTRPQLECCVEAWQHSPTASGNSWYRHAKQLQPALSWLQALPAAVCFLAGFTTELQPAEFVPYIEYKEAVQAYQWIGAGRDSDAKLQTLYHHWINNRSVWSDGWLPKGEDLTHVSLLQSEPVEEEGEEDDSEESIPLPRFPTSWVVQPASEEEKILFRSQEKLRYERPHKAFTYRVHGYEAVVGPVKGIYSQHSGPNKARGHSLLTPHRPAYVTILALVRDAVARLPNGEGTRAEICELLRESQYVAPLHTPAAESALNSVVSGALDRLHYEQDPCVKYLANKKLWVYLHRNRDEKEFERMHHLHGPGTLKNKKMAVRRHARPKTPSREASKPLLNSAPPNVSLDPLNTSAKVDGGQVKMLPEDILVKREISTKVLSGGVHSSISNTILRNINNNAVSDRNSSSNCSFNLGSVRSTAALAGINAVVGPQVSYTAGSVQHTLLSTGHSTFLNNSFSPTAPSPNVTTVSSTAPATSSVAPFAFKGVLVKPTPSSAPAAVAAVSSAAQEASALGSFVTTPQGGASVLPLTTSTPTTTVLKVGSGGGMRTLMAGNLQTIQVSTASGIQTIRVALPSAAIAKGAVVNRVSEATGAASAPGASKRLPQQLGQLIQTSSGTHFIAAAGAGRGGLSIAQLSQVAAAAKRSAASAAQQPAIVHLSNSLPVSSSGSTFAVSESALAASASHLTVSGSSSAALGSSAPRVAVRPLVTSSGSGSSALISSHHLTSSRGEVTAVRSLSHVTASLTTTSTTTTTTTTCSSSTAVATVAVNAGARLQGIAPQQLAGLKLVQGGAHLQPGVGQKLVVSGNKVLLQGSKGVQGGVQQLVTLHQQKQPLAGGPNSSLQSVTLVPQSSVVTTGASQQRLIVANVNSSGSGNKGGRGVGNVISIGNKLILTAQNAAQRGGGSGGGGGGQVLLSGDKLGQVLLNGDKIAGQVLNIGGQQVLVAAPGSTGSAAGQQQQQQIVLPASVLQSGHISIKGLQGFHTLKVVPSVSSNTTTVTAVPQTSSLGGRAAKPVVARVLQQAQMRPTVSQQASFSNQTLVSGALPSDVGLGQATGGLAVASSRLGAPSVSSSRLGAPAVSSSRLGALTVSSSRLGAPTVSSPRLGAPAVASARLSAPAQHAVIQGAKAAEQTTLQVPLAHVDQKLINVNNLSSNSSSYRNSQKPS